ncbi:MAG: hypothetical protein MUF55_01245 [Hydrogenophaga sp.]|nr:hypothetical protein [Hydrogenophaga sp.]
MTLGRYSGAAVIGRPLDIRAQLLLSPGEDVSSLCVSADVFYGDSQVGGVQTQIQQTAPDAAASLRIQVAQAINEPVVTVFVRAGCEAPFSRRYVLLADPVSDPLPEPMPAARTLPLAPQQQATSAQPVPAQGEPAEAASTAAGATEQAPASGPSPAPAARVPARTRARPGGPPAAA